MSGADEAKGSLKHIRWYVNHMPGLLSGAIFSAAPLLAVEARGDLRWVSPLAADDHIECWNERFLERLDLVDNLEAFQAFWPFSGAGTPHWDALATVPLAHGSGVVMVEAKAHRGELVKPDDRTGATGKALDLIAGSCTAARTFYGVATETPPWESSFYQVGNRLAHLYWMNTLAQVPTWMVWLFFTDDNESRDPLAAHEWHREFEAIKERVGLRPGHPLEDKIVAAYLPAGTNGGSTELASEDLR